MTGRPPRLPPRDYLAPAAGFFTFCVYKRRALFGDAELCEGVLKAFRQTTTAHDVALIAYCLMPDHAHLLGQMRRGSFLKWAEACKQRSAFVARRGGIDRLWQAGYFDRLLRSDDDIIGVAAYILANPIRAGMATQIGEYDWAGSDVYSTRDLKSAMQMRPRWW